MKKLFVVMIALFTMVAFAGSVMAQAPAKPAEPSAPAPEKQAAPAPEKAKTEKPKAAKPNKATGAVTGYEAGKMIKVKAKDKEMTFDITGDTKVKGEVKEGAKATVVYKKDGDKMVATSIAVAAAKKAGEKKPAAEKKPAEKAAAPAAPAAPAPEKK